MAHLLLGAALALPDVGGHDALHLLAQPRVLLELGRDARGQRHVHTGHERGHQLTHPSPGTPGHGVGDTRNARKVGRRAWVPRKLMAPSHRHPLPPSVASKGQCKDLPGPRPSSLALAPQLRRGRSRFHREKHRVETDLALEAFGGPRRSLTLRPAPCLPKGLEGQPGGQSSKD